MRDPFWHLGRATAVSVAGDEPEGTTVLRPPLLSVLDTHCSIIIKANH